MDSGVFVLITLQKLFEAIKKGDEDDVYKLIFQLGLHEMYPDDAMKFLIRLLVVCADAELDNDGIIATLIASVERSTDDVLSVVARLFLDESIDDDTLRYTIIHLPHVTYVSVMLEYIAYDRNPNLVLVYKRISRVFGPQEIDVYNTLLNDAKEEDNQMVVAFLGRIVGEISAPMVKPAWVDHFLPTKDLPCEDSFANINYIYDFSVPTHDTAVDILMKGISSADITEGEYDKIRDEKSILLSQITYKQRQEMLQPIIENMICTDRSDDVRLFRIYGPVNPHMNQAMNLKDNPYGGARMLTDNSYNSIDEDFGSVIYNPEWFLGYCQECYQKIPKRCYALRIPMILGGFAGCFCSKNCIIKNNDYFDELKDEPSQIQLTMIDLLEEQLKIFGLQDRISSELCYKD